MSKLSNTDQRSGRAAAARPRRAGGQCGAASVLPGAGVQVEAGVQAEAGTRGLHAVGEAVEPGLGDPEGAVQRTEVYGAASGHQLGEVDESAAGGHHGHHVRGRGRAWHLCEGPGWPPW